VTAALRRRSDEIGELGQALEQSARALWARMDATEQFAADVSHEIKNPLSSIASALETLRRIEDPDKRQNLLAIIGDDVARLDRLISDIASASRVDAEISRATSVAVPVLPLLRALVDIHEATRGEAAPRLVIEGSRDESLAVLAVEDRLVQVLRNLIGNAISFSPARSTIALAAYPAGAFVGISVTDGGPGIPQARLEHIFDRFYSERPAGERFGQHSGLGLSISRQIVEALKGRISVENILGPDSRVCGARFTVELPRVGQGLRP
jgi:two-component system sensor histidine kinase ChvG